MGFVDQFKRSSPEVLDSSPHYYGKQYVGEEGEKNNAFAIRMSTSAYPSKLNEYNHLEPDRTKPPFRRLSIALKVINRLMHILFTIFCARCFLK